MSKSQFFLISRSTSEQGHRSIRGPRVLASYAMPPLHRTTSLRRVPFPALPARSAHRAPSAPEVPRERRLAVTRFLQPRPVLPGAFSSAFVVAASGSCPAGFSSPPPPEDETTSSGSASSKRAKELRAVSSLPRPSGNRRRHLPLVGETQPFVVDHLRFALERAWRHGPVFRSSLYGMKNVVVATDFDSIDKIMSNEHVLTEWFQVKKKGKETEGNIFTTSKRTFFLLNLHGFFLPPPPFKKIHSAPLQPASFQRLLGTASSASVMADKQRHGRQRRQQAKAFSTAALASYAPRVAAATEAAVALWANKCDGGGREEEEKEGSDSSSSSSLDLGAALSDLTWAYALVTVVDVSLDAEESESVRAAWDDFTKNLFSAPLDFPGSRFRTALTAR